MNVVIWGDHRDLSKHPEFRLVSEETVAIEEDGEAFICKTFMQYCLAVQYPEPTGVERNLETEKLAVQLINDGQITCRQAYSAAAGGYKFTDMGNEYVSMRRPSEFLKALQDKGIQVRPITM